MFLTIIRRRSLKLQDQVNKRVWGRNRGRDNVAHLFALITITTTELINRGFLQF